MRVSTRPLAGLLVSSLLFIDPRDLPASDSPTPVFESRVEMVELDLSVRDRGGRCIAGLTLPDLAVLEDGVPQTPAYLLGEPRPLDLVLLIDTSASLEPVFGRVRQAARRLIRSLRPGDAAEIRTFSARAGILQGMTDDASLLEGALDRLTASGETALHDALYVALSERRPLDDDVRRPVVVLITDGVDTASHVTDDQVMERARASRSLAVFAIGLPVASRDSSERSRYFLGTLSAQTGGRAFFPATADSIPEIFEDIAAELGGRYAIGYQPTNAARNGAWRRVAVRILNRPGVEVRHRAGYYADGRRRGTVAGR
jgi:Ca-activated chloride channel family protein